MGLKDWLAKRAGVGAYGGVMGREAVKNGLAVGRWLYLGHGTGASPSSGFVFEDDADMKANGLTLYCSDPDSLPPAEDSSQLSMQTRAAGIALAAHCGVAAASNFMKKANAEEFFRSMGYSIRTEIRQLNVDIAPDIVDHYFKLSRPPAVLQVLNTDNPGTNDLLFVLLQEIKKQIRDVGFRRTGALGFDLIAVPLALETVKTIHEASQSFGW